MAYVYELKDTMTGKWYVGSRTAKGCAPEDLGVSYFTSSRIVEPIYRAEPSRFKSKILVSSEDIDYTVRVEASVLEFRDAKNDPMSYNAHNGDGNWNAVKGGKASKKLKKGVHSLTREQLCKLGKKAGDKFGTQTGNRMKRELRGVCSPGISSIGGRLGGKSTGSQLWECKICSMKTIPGALGKHQKATGHVGKTRLT